MEEKAAFIQHSMKAGKLLLARLSGRILADSLPGFKAQGGGHKKVYIVRN